MPSDTLEQWDHPEIKLAAEELEKLAGDDQFRWEYIAREKFIRDHATEIVLRYQLGLEEGEAIGLEKGEAIGLERGEAIGLEKGEAIGLERGQALGEEVGRQAEKKILAKKLHATGQSVADIAALLELDEAEIQAWLEEGEDE